VIAVAEVVKTVQPKTDLKKSVIHKLYHNAGIKRGRNTTELYDVTNTYFRNLVYQVYTCRKLATNRITIRDTDIVVVSCIRGEK